MKNKTCDVSRRDLLKKAYVAPVVIALGTMTSVSELEAKMGRKHGSSSLSHDNNGWGNGDHDAPGKSGKHNNAENNRYGKLHKKHAEKFYNR